MATIKRRFVLCLAWAGIGALAATAVSLPAADDAAMGLSPVPPAKPLPSFLPPEPPLDTTGTEPLSWKHLECLREYAWWKLFDLHPRLLRHNYRLAQAQTSVLKREWRQSLVYDLEIDADRGIRKAFGHPCTWYGEWQDPRDCDKWKTNATRDTEERQEWRLPVPDCMVKLLGSDFFWHVVGIRSPDARSIAQSQDLPYLRCVDLSSPRSYRIPLEADLQALSRLPHLTHVNLRGSGIGDQGLRYLSGLKWLTHLDLAVTEVTDEGLSHLTSLRRLTHLDLHGSRSTRASHKGMPASVTSLL